jgi:hypothetical protein
MATASEARPRRWVWLWATCYMVLIGTIVGSLFYAKRRMLAEFSNGTIVRDWQTWRDDVQQHEETLGPIERRVPTSVEPPALVLMRDYFGVSLAGAVVFTTLLYWIVVWLVTGAISTAPGLMSNEPRTARHR